MAALTPITRRRLDAFKRNRRGFYAFWIFVFCFVASLGAEFIANDKPILVSYKGEWLFPPLSIIRRTNSAAFWPRPITATL